MSSPLYSNEADATVADLPNVGSLTGTELFYADNGTQDVNVTANQIKSFAQGQISAADVTGLGPFATGTDAANLTGTIDNARLSAVPNSALANSSVTISGHPLALGGTLSLVPGDAGLGNVTNDVQTKASIVPNTAPAAGNILVGNAGGTAYAPVAMSGDATIASTGAVSVSAIGGVAPGSFYSGTNAANLTGTINNARLSAVPNTALANSSVTISGHAVSLGGTLSLAQTDVGLSAVTNDAQTKAAVVPNTAPSAGQVLIGNAGGTAYAPVSLSGDATLASTGAVAISAIGGVVPGPFYNGTNAASLTGTINNARLSAIPNTALANSSVTISGHPLSLGGTLSLAKADVGLSAVTNDIQTKAAIVPNTAPTAGQLLVGNAGGTAYAPVAVSGDATLSSAGALTVTKTNGTVFGSAATKNTGTTAGTVAAGDDSRITGAAQKANNLSDLTNAATARANLVLGTSATQNTGTGPLNVVQLDGSSRLPAVDGSQLFNITATPILRGHIFGLTLSTAGSSATFSVDVGQATSDDYSTAMTLASSLSKTTLAWAVGSGFGSLDTGSIAANTWYHVFLIERTDTNVVDVLVSLSATAPTMPTNYTKKRRIGAMQTDGSSLWVAFTQTGDDFALTTGGLDVNASVGTSRSLLTLSSAPPSVLVRFRAYTFHATQTPGIVLQPTSETDAAPSGSGAPLYSLFSETANKGAAAEFEILTDSFQQIAARSSQASTILRILTVGWRDRRGRDA